VHRVFVEAGGGRAFGGGWPGEGGGRQRDKEGELKKEVSGMHLSIAHD